MDAAVSINWISYLLNWLLGLATFGVLGIVAMNVQLWVLKARFDAHERNCEIKHRDHEKNFDTIYNRIYHRATPGDQQ